MFENHPGHDTECHLKIRITAKPNGTSQNGFACSWTGGHCLPCEKCDSFRLAHKKEST